MGRRILLSTIAASAAIVLTASTAHAQQRADEANRSQRVVATYALRASGQAIAFPTTIVVADSAGTLVASTRLKGESTARPLAVSVIESDLVLQGETPNGLLTVVLDRQATGTEPRVTTGRWALGKTGGNLRGRQL